MENEIVDMIAQSKIEGRKPRFNVMMVKFIVQRLREESND